MLSKTGFIGLLFLDLLLTGKRLSSPGAPLYTHPGQDAPHFYI